MFYPGSRSRWPLVPEAIAFALVAHVNPLVGLLCGLRHVCSFHL
jgi:MFS superfamily sulfate permease-like transporter